MHDTIKEMFDVLYYAQETDNQSLINDCALEIARKIKDENPNLDYKQLLYQYGYNDSIKKNR